MAYEPYATPEYYQDTYNGSMIPADQLEKALREASRHIDSPVSYTHLTLPTTYSV